MKKLLAGVLLIGAVVLTGCVPQPLDLYYEGKLHQEGNIEELIEDKLEQENGLDLEVNIYEEAEE